MSTFIDFISSAQGGVNSGVNPLLLQKDQIAFGFNCSVRGGFLNPRPPVQKKTTIYTGPVQQAFVEGGFFQGGGFYRPDSGPQQIIAQISGRLFAFTETGPSFTVSEISVPGDTNDPTGRQAWMWQSEKWMIISDGSGKLPIFYDGITSRRSYGPSVVLAITVASGNFPSPRVIGEVLTVNLTGNYTGPFNIPVLFNGSFYQPTQSLLGYGITLTNVSALSGATVPTGASVMVQTSYIGKTSIIAVVQNGVLAGQNSLSLSFNQPHGLSIGQQVSVPATGTNWTVAQIFSPTQVLVGSTQGTVGQQIPSGTLIQLTPAPSPSVLIGATIGSFVVPAVGASVNASIDTAYTGAPNAIVWIGTDEYTIAAFNSGLPASTIYLINLTDTANAGQAIPVGANILSVPELPAGRMGAYGLQQNWMSLTDGLSFIFSDISGSASGTPANNYRDAVLKTTQLTFRAGNFSIPSSGETINAIWFTANLDQALGQGSLLIGTDSTIFNCIAPVDAASLSNITSPILTETLIGNGPLGQNSTNQINSDTFFRSNIGDGSLVLARREFVDNSWGNRSISNEIQRILDQDNKSLLSYGSASGFDNRFNSLCSPQSGAQGIYHRGMTSLNFDLLSSLRGIVPPAWEGLWTGINSLQIIKGRVSGVIRMFAFTTNLITRKLEFYEILHEADSNFQDNDTTPILWGFETPVLMNKDIKPLTVLCQLNDGEVYVSKIEGTVQIEVQYRPDFYSCWTTWRKFSVCASSVTNPQSGYRMRIGLGTPDVKDCEAGNNRPLRIGNFFQFRVMIRGSCQWNGMKISSVSVDQPQFAPVECSLKPCQEIDCTPPDYYSLYSLQTTIPN